MTEMEILRYVPKMERTATMPPGWEPQRVTDDIERIARLRPLLVKIESGDVKILSWLFLFESIFEGNPSAVDTVYKLDSAKFSLHLDMRT